MTMKGKKRFWAKVLAFMLIASMMVGNMATSSYAAAIDGTNAPETNVDADTQPPLEEEPKADEQKTDEQEEESTETDASKDDAEKLETPTDESKKDDVTSTEKTAEELKKDDTSKTDSKGEDENTSKEDAVPKDVQAFLDAVAGLPDSIKTGEEFDAVEAAMENLLSQYDGLSDEARNSDSVKGAKSKLDTLQEQLENGRPETDEEISAAVKAFLDAVDAIEVPEEDLMLKENAELADSYSVVVYEAIGLYDELTEEEKELEKVDVAYMELVNMAMVLPDFAASTYALSNVVVDPDYNPGQCYPGVSKHGGSVTKNVGEDGFYQRRAVKNFYCPTCGWFFGQSTGKEYANIQWKQSADGVIKDVSFTTGVLDGYQCLEMDFTGAKAGTTLVTLQYDVNFHTRWNSGYAACPGCGTGTSVQQYDDNWYHYEDTFYVTVEGDSWNGSHIYWAYVPTDGVKNGSAVVEITRPYTDTRFQYPILAEIRNPKLVDEDGINGVYADITTKHCGQFGGSGPKYEVDMTITGLDTPTLKGEYVSVYLTYDIYTYNTSYYPNNPLGNLKLVKSNWTDEVRIIVYDPETVPLKVGESFTHSYKGNSSYGNNFVFNQNPVSSDSSIVQVSNTSNTSYYKAEGLKESEGKEVTVTSSFARYQYYSNVYGVDINTPRKYVRNFYYTPDLTFVDTVKYTVTNATETPVTIVKEFDGITAEQIPDDFELDYKVNGCATHNSVSGTLTREGATLTNADGTPRLSWNVNLPVAKHGSTQHTITFTEKNAVVSNYKAPTIIGNTVKLEDLTIEDGASRSVITVTNKYELQDNVFELVYDLNGGSDGPATQIYTGAENAHEFKVAGKESPIKIPTNGNKVFKGWSNTLNGSVDYAYNNTTEEYSPDKVTVTKAQGETSASKTIYAVWEEYQAPKAKLTKLDKVRLTSLPTGVTLPDDVTVNYSPTVVFLGDNPADVTLLYKITVTGEAGAKYKVTDPGAVWIKGGDNHETDKENGELIVTGKIGENQTIAEIYVIKTFKKADIDANGRLTNNATLESDDPDTTEGPTGDNGKGSGSSDAQKKYNVTINFVTDDEKPETLQDPTTNIVDENEKFGIGYEQPQSRARSNSSASGTLAIYIPKTISKGENTYALDMVLSEDALNALRTAGEAGVTQDIVKNIIYSLDMKGGSDDDKPEGGFDGTPDKYQAKITYQAADGGSQNGVNGYVTITVDGTPNGTLSTMGKAPISATATSKANYYFVEWTATGEGHEEWTFGPSKNATLGSTIDAKGGAEYTFTASFELKTVLNIKVVGENDTKPYSGEEQSVYGYTMTVTTNGTEIELPAGLAISPALNDCVAKGTDVGTYPMRLTSDGFSLTGADADKYSAVFEVEDGWLTIEAENALTVSAGDVSVTYDGTEHPVTPVSNKTGATVTITYYDGDGNELSGVPTDAGEYTAKIVAELEGYDDAEYTAKVTIAKRGLTIITGSGSKTYDGTALRNDTITVEVTGGAVAGEEITATATGSQTEVGSSNNTYTINWGNAKESNYEVTEVLGTLTVNAVTPPTPPTPPTPTPGGGGGTGGGGTPDPTPTPAPAAVLPIGPTVIPAAAPTAAAPAATPEEEPVENIEDAETPLANDDTPAAPEAPAEEIEIGDEETPLAGGRSWALLNLILAILTVVVSVVLLVGYFFGKKKDQEEDDEVQAYQDEEQQEELKRKGLARILSILPAVVSVIFFILTENMRNPMIFVDKWTLWMVVFAIANVALAILSKKTRKDDDDNKQKPGYEMA